MHLNEGGRKVRNQESSWHDQDGCVKFSSHV